ALVEDLKVALAPPLAVAEDVDAGRLLQRDREGNGLVAGALPFGRRQSARHELCEQIEQPRRPRQAADDGGREQRETLKESVHRSHLVGQVSDLSIRADRSETCPTTERSRWACGSGYGSRLECRGRDSPPIGRYHAPPRFSRPRRRVRRRFH